MWSIEIYANGSFLKTVEFQKPYTYTGVKRIARNWCNRHNAVIIKLDGMEQYFCDHGGKWQDCTLENMMKRK